MMNLGYIREHDDFAGHAELPHSEGSTNIHFLRSWGIVE